MLLPQTLRVCDSRFRVWEGCHLETVDMRPWAQYLGGGITLETVDL